MKGLSALSFGVFTILLVLVRAKLSIYNELDRNDNIIKVQGMEQLKEVIEEHPFVLVFYYSSSGCGNCDNAVPWFIQAADELEDHDPPITFAALDNQESGNDDALAKKMAVRSWFTLRIYQGNIGEFLPYKGPKYREGMPEELRAIRTGRSQQEIMTNKKVEDMRNAPAPPTPNIEPEDSEVITLTDKNFYDVVNSNDYVLVKFYAPWCGHCKKMAPAFTETSIELKDTKYKVAKIDVTQEEHFAIRDRYEIRGFPNLKLFRGNENSQVDYSGDRSKDDMINFIYKQAGSERPPAKERPKRKRTAEKQGSNAEGVMTLGHDNFDSVINSHDLVMVKFYAPWCGHCKSMAPAYEQAARSLKNTNWKLAELDATVSENTPIVQRYGVRGYPTIKVFKGNQYNHVDYSGDRSKEDLLRFIREQGKTLPGSARQEL